MRRLEVKLPICRLCGRVGKVPNAPRVYNLDCTCDGGTRGPHKRTRMQWITFREVRPRAT